jgi:hypothetical protein
VGGGDFNSRTFLSFDRQLLGRGLYVTALTSEQNERQDARNQNG